MRIFVAIIFLVALSSPVTFGAIVETQHGPLEVPEFEDYVELGTTAKQTVMESQTGDDGSEHFLFARVKPEESQRSGDFSHLLTLAELHESNILTASEFRAAAREMHTEVKQAVGVGLPGVKVGELVLTDTFFLIIAEMQMHDAQGKTSCMRNLSGGALIDGRLFPITALIVSGDSNERDIFTLKVRTWVQHLCALNTRQALPNGGTPSENDGNRERSPQGTFIMPPHFEARGGVYGEMAGAAMQAAHMPTPGFALQQKGLNEGDKEAFSHYARMLQGKIELDLEAYLSRPAGQAVNLDGQDNPIALIVQANLGTSRLLEVETSEMTFFGGHKSVKVVFRRQMDQKPPVRVILYLTPVGKCTIQTVFSYRISDTIDWATEIAIIENSFEFEK